MWICKITKLTNCPNLIMMWKKYQKNFRIRCVISSPKNVYYFTENAKKSIYRSTVTWKWLVWLHARACLCCHACIQAFPKGIKSVIHWCLYLQKNTLSFFCKSLSAKCFCGFHHLIVKGIFRRSWILVKLVHHPLSFLTRVCQQNAFGGLIY